MYFLCPEISGPSGGVRKTYEFARNLRAAGVEAVVVHGRRGFRVPGLAGLQVPVLAARDARPSGGDLVVVPEMFGYVLPDLAPGIPKLILNQAPYLARDEFFLSREVISITVVSEHSASYARRAYPGVRIERIHCGVDPSIFHPGVKKRQIAYMPRRRADDIRLVLNALKRSGSLDGWDLRPIDRMAIPEVAEVLSESTFFFSFSQREGFGLPPLEAMSCGCVVVGFHGHGGREYFDPEHCFPVVEDDIDGFVEQASAALASWEAGGGRIEQMSQVATQVARQCYPLDREQSDVINVFGGGLRAAQSWGDAPRQRSTPIRCRAGSDAPFDL